jgi:hypothetical protein
MTARVCVSGILLHAPESRTLKAGGQVATATLKSKDSDCAQFWRVVAFSEPVQTELLHLTDGDAVAVQGALKAELCDRGGEIQLSVGVIAEHVLRLSQRGKKRERDATWPPSFLQRECRSTWPPSFLQRECRSKRRFCRLPDKELFHEARNTVVDGSVRSYAGRKEDPMRCRTR